MIPPHAAPTLWPQLILAILLQLWPPPQYHSSRTEALALFLNRIGTGKAAVRHSSMYPKLKSPYFELTIYTLSLLFRIPRADRAIGQILVGNAMGSHQHRYRNDTHGVPEIQISSRCLLNGKLVNYFTY